MSTLTGRQSIVTYSILLTYLLTFLIVSRVLKNNNQDRNKKTRMDGGRINIRNVRTDSDIIQMEI